MKLIFTLIILCAPLCIPLAAQETNLHAAGTIQLNGGLGFANPVYGGTAGVDVRAGKAVFSVDLDASRIEKTVGGQGYRVTARQTARVYLRPQFFVQAGAIEQHYAVKQFSKSSVQPLVGFGFASIDGKQIWQFNYRHDINSENKQRIFEGTVTLYLARHLFVRGAIGLDHFRSGRVSQGGAASSVGFGFHF